MQKKNRYKLVLYTQILVKIYVRSLQQLFYQFLQCNSIEKSKNTRILLGNCISKFSDKSWNFLEKLGISKFYFGFSNFFSEYFIEISRIIKRILFFYFGNSKIFQKIPRFIRKFRNAIAKQNSGIFLFFNRVALQKLICL